MTDVFISYSHKDSDYAHRLADELKRHHIDVWIDDRIDYGDRWPQTIQQNLSACRTVIVIMSTNAFNSMWVQNEVSYAQANHKTIFPLLLEGDVWLSMSAMQYVDVRAETMPPPRFFEKIAASLKGPTPHRPSPVPVGPPVGIHPKKEKTNTGRQRTGLFIGGILLVFAVVASILYILNPPGPSTPPITQAPATAEPTEPPGSDEPTSAPGSGPSVEPDAPDDPAEPPPTELPVGTVVSARGRLTYLRVHDVGTGYGGASDFLDVEVVIKLDSEPEKAFGFQLRSNVDETTNAEMLELLRDSFNTGNPVSIDYIKTSENSGMIVRVLRLP